jgi:tRNA G18 (ribose-2'-O)-methylase SpoU
MDPAKCFLVIYNVSKKHNVGSIIRSAAAMNVSEVWVIGKKKLASFGNQGTAKRVVYRFFDDVNHLKTHATQSKVQILGVEIMEQAKSIWTFPFSGSTAFVMGNEGTGLSDLEKEICDGFIYIPQYQSNTESLNVSVAAGIVLNHFARKT